MGKRAQDIRRHEEGLEAGRFDHLDREFQDRVHALRVEENALKSRYAVALEPSTPISGVRQ